MCELFQPRLTSLLNLTWIVSAPSDGLSSRARRTASAAAAAAAALFQSLGPGCLAEDGDEAESYDDEAGWGCSKDCEGKKLCLVKLVFD